MVAQDEADGVKSFRFAFFVAREWSYALSYLITYHMITIIILFDMPLFLFVPVTAFYLQLTSMSCISWMRLCLCAAILCSLFLDSFFFVFTDVT